jgi:hypothetical protein
MRVKTRRLLLPVLFLVPALLACPGKDPVVPPTSYAIAVYSGDDQIGAVGMHLEDPLQAVVTDQRSGRAVAGVQVDWTVAEGVAQLTTVTMTSDANGLVVATAQLGENPGTTAIDATLSSGNSAPARFTVRAVLRPRITAIIPQEVTAGAAVTIVGENFSTRPDDNAVLFGGFRAGVTSSTLTEIRAVVPACVPTNTVAVVVRLGGAVSEPVAVQATGFGGSTLELAPGQAVAFTEPADLSCVRLPADADAEYLVVPLNATAVTLQPMPFLLAAIRDAASIVDPPSYELETWAAAPDPATTFEGWLRAQERLIPDDAIIRPGLTPGFPLDAQPLSVPSVGDQRTFNVITPEQRFQAITARAMAVSNHAIIYQDVTAPSGGFSSSDFQYFGQLFDDPIFPTSIDIFGLPSDIDNNQRVIILFTPIVNEWTPRGSGGGFVAGFFYSYDLSTQPGSNRAEIFYSLVPDPAGVHGDVRRTDQLRNVVPPVLAHEFQHMIHFNQRTILRGAPWEALWLSEGLAHLAEDLVGDAFAARGDAVMAQRFKQSNYLRTAEYLSNPSATSMITTQGQGTLAERGAAWVFLRYIMSHYGGLPLITNITHAIQSSSTNVSAQTGVAWAALMQQFSVALWADDAPTIQGPLDSIYTIAGLNLRSLYQSFPLQPPVLGFSEFQLTGTLESSAPAYLLLRAPQDNIQPLHLVIGGRYGGAFPEHTGPALSLLRVR